MSSGLRTTTVGIDVYEVDDVKWTTFLSPIEIKKKIDPWLVKSVNSLDRFAQKYHTRTVECTKIQYDYLLL